MLGSRVRAPEGVRRTEIIRFPSFFRIGRITRIVYSRVIRCVEILDERHIPPKTTGYESKGFTEQSVIQDFPLRGKPVYLHIRRRKWLEKDTGKVITNSYDVTHLGAQITAEFAAFLKDIYRK